MLMKQTLFSGKVGLLTGVLFGRVSDGESEPVLPTESWEMVRSWSYPGKVSLPPEDLEESTPADEYFTKDTPTVIIEEIMADLIDKVTCLSGDVEVIFVCIFFH